MTNKRGIMVVFEGTDGSGKTTIINELNKCNIDLFSGRYSYYHWRPGFIKKKEAQGKAVNDPHAKPPYGKIKSMAKFLFFNVDFVLGYWLKVRKELLAGNLVVFDRYYYDYYLDKLRYRLTIDNRILDLFLPIIPKPDITFLLIGNPKILYERKKEIPIGEITSQLDLLNKNKNKIANSTFVNVDDPIDVVVEKVAKKIREKHQLINKGPE